MLGLKSVPFATVPSFQESLVAAWRVILPTDFLLDGDTARRLKIRCVINRDQEVSLAVELPTVLAIVVIDAGLDLGRFSDIDHEVLRVSMAENDIHARTVL